MELASILKLMLKLIILFLNSHLHRLIAVFNIIRDTSIQSFLITTYCFTAILFHSSMVEVISHLSVF